jgi:hypothetical protein
MSFEVTESRSSAPSRRDNPFATCWTMPGALPFYFQNGQSVEQLVATLAGQNWCGQIIGPHGSGKSTLLAALIPALVAAGRDVREIRLHDRMRALPRDVTTIDSARALIVVDGFEQLGRLARHLLKRSSRRAGTGLLVTAHAAVGLPTLIQLSPSPHLIEELVDQLCGQVHSGVSRADVAASHASHGSNVREIFFELYDRHEQMRRALRTAAADTA